MKQKLAQSTTRFVASCISSITVFCFISKAIAQDFTIPEIETIGPQAIQFVQTCQQVNNLLNANPGNPNLQIYANNCNLQLDKYRICLVE